MSEWEGEASYQQSRRIAAEGERDDWMLEADILQGKIDALQALLDRAIEALGWFDDPPATTADRSAFEIRYALNRASPKVAVIRAILADYAALKGVQG